MEVTALVDLRFQLWFKISDVLGCTNALPDLSNTSLSHVIDSLLNWKLSRLWSSALTPTWMEGNAYCVKVARPMKFKDTRWIRSVIMNGGVYKLRRSGGLDSSSLNKLVYQVRTWNLSKMPSTFTFEWNTPRYNGKTSFNTGIFIGGQFLDGSNGKTIE